MEGDLLDLSTQILRSSHDEDSPPKSNVNDIFRPAENPGGRRRVRPVVESASSTSTASTWKYLCAPKYCAVPQFLETEATKEFFVNKEVPNAANLHTVRYVNRDMVFEKKEMLADDSGIVIPDCSEDEVSDYMSYDSSSGKEQPIAMTRRKTMVIQRAQYEHNSEPTTKDIEGSENQPMSLNSKKEKFTREKVKNEYIKPVGRNVNTDSAKVRMASKIVTNRGATGPIVFQSVQESSTRSGMTDNSILLRDVKSLKAGDGVVMKRRVYAEIVDDSSFGCPAAESFDDDASNISTDSYKQTSKKNTICIEESRDVVEEALVPKQDCPRQESPQITKAPTPAPVPAPAPAPTPDDHNIDTVELGSDNIFPPNITNLGWIPKLIIFLSSDKSSIVEAALIELGKLADTDVDPSEEETVVPRKKKVDVNNDENEKRSHDVVVKDIALAFQYGIHASLIGVMNKWFRFPEIQLLACSILHAFGAINENFRLSACGLGALEALLQAMNNFRNYPEIQSQCCACICCYSTNIDIAKQLLANLNGLQTIIQTMYEHPDNAFLQMWCCSALEYMTSCPSLKPYMPSDDTVQALLHVSAHFNDSTNTDHCLISHQARTAIERLIPSIE